MPKPTMERKALNIGGTWGILPAGSIGDRYEAGEAKIEAPEGPGVRVSKGGRV